MKLRCTRGAPKFTGPSPPGGTYGRETAHEFSSQQVPLKGA
jgi:hypothetical protein